MRLVAAIAILSSSFGLAQAPVASLPKNPQLQTQSTVVLVPALVRNPQGELVFTLKADDFRVTDDGVEQKLTLDEDTDGEPLALVVVIEVGGAGAREFNQYASIAPPLAPMLETIIGNVPHKIAVVTFDSQPSMLQEFTPNIETAADAIRTLTPGCTRQHHLENCASSLAVHNEGLGDNGAAILDALKFSVDLLRNQPHEYRRAILMISETLDRGSQTTLEEALRAVTDTRSRSELPLIRSFIGLSFAYSRAPAECSTPYSQMLSSKEQFSTSVEFQKHASRPILTDLD
jgi:VWFA-related protein